MPKRNQAERSAINGWGWVVAAILVVLLIAFYGRDESECSEVTSSTYQQMEGKHEVFVKVEVPFMAEQEFDCASYDFDIELNRTSFKAPFILVGEDTIEWFENEHARYRVSRNNLETYYDVPDSIKKFRDFMWDAEETKAEHVRCWSFLMDYKLGVNATFYDEGYAETKRIASYDRIVYDCFIEDPDGRRLAKWDCYWLLEGQKVDHYRGDIDRALNKVIRDAIVEEGW